MPSHPSENNSSGNQRGKTLWDNWRVAIQSRIEIRMHLRNWQMQLKVDFYFKSTTKNQFLK